MRPVFASGFAGCPASADSTFHSSRLAVYSHLRQETAPASTAPTNNGARFPAVEPIERTTPRVTSWISAGWVRYGIVGLSAALIAEGLMLDNVVFPVAQFMLLASAYAAARMLSRRPLVDPLQGLLAYFYWWFGVGPIVICGYDLIVGNSVRAVEIAGRFNLGTLVVAIGLPFYSFAAAWTLQKLERTECFLRFLQPRSENYSKRTILLFLIGWILSAAIVSTAGGIVEVNQFGGTVTLVWWVGILASCARFFLAFAQSTLLWSFSAPGGWRRQPRWFWIAGGCVLGYSVYSGIFSGSKGEIVQIGALGLIAYVTTRQRIPWFFAITGLSFFLIAVAPFVRTGRIQMELEGSDGGADRKETFRALLQNRSFLVDGFDPKQLDIESPFRGVYEVAGEIANRSGSLGGPLDGTTITAGLEALVPRAISPEKPEMNIGNVFTHVYGSALGISADNDINNIAPSLPFEMVANYGLVAGVISFPLIGVGWAVFCCLLLSPARMANHPLAPWLVLSAGKFEGALGPVLAWGRDLPFTLLLIWLIRAGARREL